MKHGYKKWTVFTLYFVKRSKKLSNFSFKKPGKIDIKYLTHLNYLSLKTLFFVSTDYIGIQNICSSRRTSTFFTEWGVNHNQEEGGGVDKYVYLKVLKYYYIRPNLSQ